MKSFIPWIGSKSLLRKRIIDLFPAQEPSMYVEVFGGAGWVLFGKDKHAAVEVLNDINGHLVNLYRCIQYHCEELQRELCRGGGQEPFVSREVFLDYKEQLEVRGLTDIQRAARYYYIIRASYGANQMTFCCTKRMISDSIHHLKMVQQRLKAVVIENRDFESILKTYNKPGTLFYLDPPYFAAEKYYKGFGHDDHLRLKAAIEKIKGKFILSYNDVPYIHELYSSYNILEVERNNNLGNAAGSVESRYKELIIMNY